MPPADSKALKVPQSVTLSISHRAKQNKRKKKVQFLLQNNAAMLEKNKPGHILSDGPRVFRCFRAVVAK